MPIIAHNRITRGQQRLLVALNEAVGNGGWTIVPGPTMCVRWDQTVETPDTAPPAYRDRPTFERHVFVTVLVTNDRWSTTVEIAPVPWVTNRTVGTTQRSALDALANPEGLF